MKTIHIFVLVLVPWDIFPLRNSTKILHERHSSCSSLCSVYKSSGIQILLFTPQNIMFLEKKDQMSSKVNTKCKSKPQNRFLPITNYSNKNNQTPVFCTELMLTQCLSCE